MRRFIIVSTQRTGSTLLCTSLNKHTNIRCHGEIMLRKARSYDSYWYYYKKRKIFSLVQSLCSSKYGKYIPNWLHLKLMKPYLNKLYSREPLSRPWREVDKWNHFVEEDNLVDYAVGFKLMYSQIIRNHAIKKYLSNQRVSIIYLYRNDLIAKFISLKKAEQSGIYHTQKQSGFKRASFEVSIDELRKYLISEQKSHMYLRKFQERFSKHNHELTYESLSNNFNHEMNQVGEFLKCKQFFYKPSLEKISIENYNSFILNWKSVQKFKTENEKLCFLDYS